jgi:glucose/arabinose dehydrogenase
MSLTGVSYVQAHSVPLDIKFYPGAVKAGTTQLPASLKGQAFVSFRGSFNRTPPTGYGVVRLVLSLPSFKLLFTLKNMIA